MAETTIANQTWGQMAAEISKLWGVEAAIVQATIEAETGGRNIKHSYLPKYDQCAYGYGGVLVYWHFGRFKPVAAKLGISVPSWVGTISHPKGANAEKYGQLLLDNPRLSIGVMVDIVKNYWESSGQNFRKFTLAYVGPSTPESDIKRRQAIYDRWKQGSGNDSEIESGDSAVVDGSEQSVDYWQNGKEYTLESEKYTGEVFDTIHGIIAKPEGLPPHYYQDDWGKLAYRFMSGDYFMRIGDARFVVPPTQIKVSEDADIQTYNMLRQRNSMKTVGEGKIKTIECTLMFNGYNQINGYAMDGPDKATYAMDGFRALLAQMKAMPFLPVENELLNNVFEIDAVAILNVHVETVQGFPGVLQAHVTMVEYNTIPFLNKPSWMYDQHFMWPLFRWHYQKQLNGEGALRPYTEDSSFMFRYINEESLQNAQANINAINQQKLKEGQREKSWMDYDPSSFLFDDYTVPGTLIPISLSATTGNNLTPLAPLSLASPVYQYLGSQDTRFQVIFQTDDRAAIQSMFALKERLDHYARTYHDRFVGAFLRVDHSFINLMGVSSVMIESLSMQTIPGRPGVFYLSLTLISYEETQFEDYKLGLVSGRDQGRPAVDQLSGYSEAGFDNNISQAVAAEEMMDQMELYPDLRLPKYKDVNKAITSINAWRKSKGLGALPVTEIKGPRGAAYVDPDFFFSYPSIDQLVERYEEIVKDPMVKALAVSLGNDFLDADERIPDMKWQDFLGEPTKQVLEKRDPDGKFKFKETYESIIGGDSTELMSKISEDFWYVRDPNNYVERFWVKAWFAEGGSWKSLGIGVDDDGQVGGHDIRYYHHKGPEQKVEMYTSQEVYKGLLHDMVKYDKRGTMLRAFPSYALIIIDEGQFINKRRLWDNYYTYHAVSEINVHMDRKNPVHTAYITLADVYGTLNYTTKVGVVDPDPGFGTMVASIWDSWFHDIKQKQLDERDRIFNAAKIFAGTRLHIRMGYGSAVSQLPVMFNGVIAEISNGSMIQMVAQSYGFELTNPIMAEPGKTNSIFEEGKDPTDLFRYYMVQRKSNYVFATREQGAPEDYQSSYGINHFGHLAMRREGAEWNDLLQYAWNKIAHMDMDKELGADDYDITKNIYLTTGLAKYGATPQQLDQDENATIQDILAEYDAPYVKQWIDANRDVTSILKGKGVEEKESNWFVEIFDSWFGGRGDEELKVISTKAHVKSLMKNIHRFNKTERKALMNAVYGFAAKSHEIWPESKEDLIGTDVDKPSNEKVNDVVEELLEPLKTRNELNDEYKAAKKILTGIGKEWRDMRYEFAIIKRDLEEADKGNDLTGEKNIVMTLDGKSPWDVWRTIERVTPEYVLYPHPHQFHYTLFFGKPWWDVQYGYFLPPIDKKFDRSKDNDYGKKISDYVELRKPFMQTHFYTSHSDIISNSVKATGTDLITAATPVFKIGNDDDDDKAYEVIWADYNISGTFQKNKVIDTTLVQNIPFIPDFLERWSAGIQNWFGGTTDYQEHSVRFAQSVIADSFRDMYQGEMVVIGDPSAKPYDLMYLSDEYNILMGNAGIGSVTHMMSMETGFVSCIKPDMAISVNPNPDEFSEDWGDDPNKFSGMFYILATNLSHGAANVAFWSATAAWIANSKKIKSAVRFAASLKYTKNATTWVKGLKAVKNISSVIKGWRVAVLAGAGLSAATGVGIVPALIAGASFLIFEQIIRSIESMFVQKYNNVIKLSPLFRKGVPYVAGINGHKSLIPGWEDDGSGRPVRVDYNNVKKHDPKKASDLLNSAKKSSDAAAAGGTYGAPYAPGVTNSTHGGHASGINPSEFVKNLKGDYIFTVPMRFQDPKKGWAEVQARTSSPYGTRTLSGKKDFHRGWDLTRGGTNKSNTDILACAKGKVMFAGPSGGYGNCIIIHHSIPQKGGGHMPFYSVHGHMTNPTKYVKPGQEVTCGQKIADQGAAGQVTGVHLHFEILIPKENVADTARAKDGNVGQDFYNFCMAGGGNKQPRTNVWTEDPLNFLNGIYLHDSSLFKWF